MPIYSDVNQTSPTNRVLVEDLDSIFQSITNILSTRTNTRLFLPEFGSELENLLFEPMDEITAARIYDYIIVAIQRWEPRVKLNYGRSTVTPISDEYRYEVFLTFEVYGLEPNTFYNFGGFLNKFV